MISSGLRLFEAVLFLGFFDSYPEGPWRPDSSVQRGSVHYMSLQPGDPSTPGYPATKDAPRVPQEDSKALPKIPSLPLSYRDAKPLLNALHGLGWNASDAPDGWKGGLDIEYWTGPGNVEVNLVNHVDFKITPIWNVMARIQGTDETEKVDREREREWEREVTMNYSPR